MKLRSLVKQMQDSRKPRAAQRLTTTHRGYRRRMGKILCRDTAVLRHGRRTKSWWKQSEYSGVGLYQAEALCCQETKASALNFVLLAESASICYQMAAMGPSTLSLEHKEIRGPSQVRPWSESFTVVLRPMYCDNDCITTSRWVNISYLCFIWK